MPTVTFTNSRNEKVTLGNEDDFTGQYFLQEITGLGDLEAINQTVRAPYQDGTTPIDSMLGERVIAMTVILIANTAAELPQLRKELSRVCNPKLGEMEIIYDDGFQVKKIRGKADSIPVYPAGKESRTKFIQHASISITCSDPYWKDPKDINAAEAPYGSDFTFPMGMPSQREIVGNNATLSNDGDVSTPVVIEIEGPVTNPRITNQTTGEYIQLNREIISGETVQITTSDQNRKVVIYQNGEIIENATGYIDFNSDFWNLEVGDNNITYSADADTSLSILRIGWQDRYVGI